MLMAGKTTPAGAEVKRGPEAVIRRRNSPQTALAFYSSEEYAPLKAECRQALEGQTFGAAT